MTVGTDFSGRTALTAIIRAAVGATVEADFSSKTALVAVIGVASGRGPSVRYRGAGRKEKYGNVEFPEHRGSERFVMEGHAGWRGGGRDARRTSAIRTTRHVMSDGLQGLADVDGFRRSFDLDDTTWRPVKQIFKLLTPDGVTIRNNKRVTTAERAANASRHFRDDFWHKEECRIFQPKGDEADGTLV